MLEQLIFVGILGGLFWRIRGGFLGNLNPGGTQVARLLGTLPLAFLALFTGGLYPALVACLHAPALALMGWWDSFSENVDIKKSFILTLRGLVQGLIVGIPLFFLGYSLFWVAILGGASFGLIHYICTRFMQNVPHISFLNSKFVDGPLSMVEILYGVVLYTTFMGVIL